MDFGGAIGANGWVLGQTGSLNSGSGNQRVGYQPTYTPWSGTDSCTRVTGGSGGGSLSKAIIGEADPTAPGASITYTKFMCVPGGMMGTFDYAWSS